MRYIRPLGLAIFFLLTQATRVYAHERWYSEQGGQHIGERHWLDWPNLALILFGVVLVALMVVIDRSARYRRIEKAIDNWQPRLPAGIEWRVVTFLAAGMLVANAVTGVFLARDLPLPGLTLTASTSSSAQISRALLSGDSVLHWWSPATFGAIAQLLLATVLLTQRTFLIPGLLILVVALPLALFNFAPDLLVDYVVEFIALAFALIFFGMGASSLDRRIATRLNLDPSRYAWLPVPIIRIGAGLTLAILALHNKLLDPNMALTFLDRHYFNFMETLGFSDFTNIRFVFAAGIVELTVGTLLVLGLATRLVAAITLALMITTIAILGPLELIGHLPIMGIAALLIFKGPGGLRLARQAQAGKVPVLNLMRTEFAPNK